MFTEKKLRQIIRHVIVEQATSTYDVESFAKELVLRSTYESDVWRDNVASAVAAARAGDKHAMTDPVYIDEILTDIYDMYGSEMAQTLGVDADQRTREDVRLYLVDFIKIEFHEWVEAESNVPPKLSDEYRY